MCGCGHEHKTDAEISEAAKKIVNYILSDAVFEKEFIADRIIASLAAASGLMAANKIPLQRAMALALGVMGEVYGVEAKIIPLPSAMMPPVKPSELN